MLEQGKLEVDSDSMKNLVKKTGHRSGQNLTDSEKILLNRWEFLFDILDNQQAEEEMLNALKKDHSKSFSWKICELLNRFEAFPPGNAIGVTRLRHCLNLLAGKIF